MPGNMQERREGIVQFVTAEGSVTFGQIKKAFPDVSEMTLRTDLKALDEARRIVRTHGGARSVEFVVGTDDLLLNRSTRNVEAKAAIARKALSLVRPDTTIFLDSGSTTTALAREMPDDRLIVFTNSLTCAAELARLERARCIMVGGNLNRYSMSLNGSKTVEDVHDLSFDLLFLGVTSYQSATGFACGSDDEAALKRALIARAEKTVVLMDSSKTGLRSTFRICGLEDVDAVISEGGLSEHFLKRCEEADVTVL
ncbi:DeoR/GlpR family DNA-binding transcription regulator [Thermophilibacter mediterraneus]|uniref:DeoR/GlpR family DNA-binding transcription regulator n=1 Tax=Thermophilibacter mediterraneus TaxID=1871031 RepID=UPI000A6BC7B5|nr:DeoR/GlpR family DNA-binding transcription regulator [Thermophilibacter mediterraneus]